MRDVRRWSPLVHLASIVLAVAATWNFARAEYTFRTDPALRTRSLTATVRIFPAQTGGEQIGSGFVIDSGDELILTAAHVVAELKDVAWVSFPRETTRHRVKLLTARPNGFGNPVALDLAILKLDPAIDNVDSLELQFDTINPEQEHGITGYGRSNREPQQADARPSFSDTCTYTIRSETLYGDSGSAVLTAAGLVDGIAVDGAESGGGASMAEMKVLPISCAMHQILELVPDGQSSKIMTTFLTGSDADLRHAFEPPPKTGWVSNLRLAKAIQGWIIAQKGKQLAMDASRVTNAVKIIVERQLGYEIAVAFSRTGVASGNDAGDAIQQFARDEFGRGSPNARRAYAVARGLYLQHASENSGNEAPVAAAYVPPAKP
jgi:hypothetical protein